MLSARSAAIGPEDGSLEMDPGEYRREASLAGTPRGLATCGRVGESDQRAGARFVMRGKDGGVLGEGSGVPTGLCELEKSSAVQVAVDRSSRFACWRPR